MNTLSILATLLAPLASAIFGVGRIALALLLGLVLWGMTMGYALAQPVHSICIYQANPSIDCIANNAEWLDHEMHRMYRVTMSYITPLLNRMASAEETIEKLEKRIVSLEAKVNSSSLGAGGAMDSLPPPRIDSPAMPEPTEHLPQSVSESLGLYVSANSISMNKGGTATFTIGLNKQPTFNVIVNITRPKKIELSKPTECASLYSMNCTLTFTPSNWADRQIKITDKGALDGSVLEISNTQLGETDATKEIRVYFNITSAPSIEYQTAVNTEEEGGGPLGYYITRFENDTIEETESNLYINCTGTCTFYILQCDYDHWNLGAKVQIQFDTQTPRGGVINSEKIVQLSGGQWIGRDYNPADRKLDDAPDEFKKGGLPPLQNCAVISDGAFDAKIDGGVL